VSTEITEHLAALRALIDRFEAPTVPKPEAHSAFLPSPASSAATEQAELAARAAALAPWRQGPFRLGDGLVLGDGADDAVRWSLLDGHVGRDLSNQRVLVVPCDAGYDAFAFAARGAAHVLACEPSDTVRQAELLESVYRAGVELRRAGWQSLNPVQDGEFEIVYCDGLLHSVCSPIALLRALRRVTAPAGSLLIGSMMLTDPERSACLQFMPDRQATWWFVPGRLAFRWMLQASGFDVEAEIGELPGPRDSSTVVRGYIHAQAGTPLPLAPDNSLALI